ncbi:monooxygenase [Dactylosporangium sp. CS-047395]|uniref:monooxygenase n=1 Tax=Dactylosporangium sp. CS-047395 TaxID=3239936 RepID=UPI003D8D0999
MQSHQPGSVGFGLRIAVVGGSLTGTATALFLAQHGFTDVTVYEASPAAATLSGGLLTLDHMVLDRLDRAGIAQHHYVHIPSETIWQVPVRHRQPGRPDGRRYPGRFTTWTRLAAALSAAAIGWLPPGAIRTGARVTGLTEHSGRPRLHLTGGGIVSADVVVFADGCASIGRRLLAPQRQLHYAGYVGYRGSIAAAELPCPAPAPPAQVPQTLAEIAGLGDFWRLQPGDGLQCNVCPVPGGLDWTCYLDTTDEQLPAIFGAAPHQRFFAPGKHISELAHARLDASVTDRLPFAFAALIHATSRRAAFPMLDVDPPARAVWPVGDGWAVLAGDALAPVRAHTGRGANHGLEQAAALTAVLGQYARHGADLGSALHGWQRRILPAVLDTLLLGPRLGHRAGLGITATASPRPTRGAEPAVAALPGPAPRK